MAKIDEGLGSALRRATGAKTTLGAIGAAAATVGATAVGGAIAGGSTFAAPGAVIGGGYAVASILNRMRKRRMTEEMALEIFEKYTLTEFAPSEEPEGKPEKPKYKLIHKSGKQLNVGDEVEDFRGDKHKILGWTAPRHEGSTGRVHLKHESGWDHHFYPSVIDAKLVQENLNEARRRGSKSLLGVILKGLTSSPKPVKKSTAKNSKPESDAEADTLKRLRAHFHNPERIPKLKSFYARQAENTPEKLQQKSTDMLARMKKTDADLAAYHAKQRGFVNQMTDSKKKVNEGYIKSFIKTMNAKKRKQAVYDKSASTHKKLIRPVDKLDNMSWNAHKAGDEKKSNLYWKMSNTEIQKIKPRVKSVEKRMAAAKGGNRWYSDYPKKPKDLNYMKGSK